MEETRKTYQESAEEYADSFFESGNDLHLFEMLTIAHEFSPLIKNPETNTNNYTINMLLINVGEGNVLDVETAYCNEYGSIHGNDDHKVFHYNIKGARVGDFIHLYDDNKMVIYR